MRLGKMEKVPADEVDIANESAAQGPTHWTYGPWVKPEGVEEI
jgi:hypothetical protein